MGVAKSEESASYVPFVESGGRPQMGFAVSTTDGQMHGFIYHSLDNIRHLKREGLEFFAFTHRGAAVTIQGTGLRQVFKSFMRHTLMKINGTTW